MQELIPPIGDDFGVLMAAPYEHMSVGIPEEWRLLVTASCCDAPLLENDGHGVCTTCWRCWIIPEWDPDSRGTPKRIGTSYPLMVASFNEKRLHCWLEAWLKETVNLDVHWS